MATYDAIVVLANLMDAKGTLNSETCARLSMAKTLFEAGKAPLIATCGWAYRDDSDTCIADAMASYAVKFMGIPKTQIISETTSRDTVGDAVFTKRNLANPRDWQSIVVVTSAYHAARTREIFSFIYGREIEVVSAESEDTPALRKSEAKSTAAFQKTFQGLKAGDDDAIFERLTSHHPFYNGEIYPVIG